MKASTVLDCRINMAGDFTVKAGWTLGPRQLNEYELVYFPVGSGTQYRVNGRVYALEEPCFVLTRPAEEHSYIFDPAMPTRHLFIHFSLDLPPDNDHLSILASPDARSVHLGHASFLPSLFKHILHLAAVKHTHWKERCNLALCMLLAELDALSGADDLPSSSLQLPPQISKALHFIDNNLHLPLSVADVAKTQGWTHEHFSRIFVRYMGISPQKAITYRRIERACQLLIQTDSTIKQIAYEVGFHDEHYFYRCFLKIKGTTASEYRRQFADPRAQHLAPTEEYRALYPLNKFLVLAQENHIK